jgi:hypothetical protein
VIAGRFAFAAPAERIYVDSFGDKPGAKMLREEIVKLLSKSRGVGVAADRSQADYILSGSGETYIRGYIGTNPRVRYLNSDAQPVYGGFLSVELKPARQDVIWADLVTPRRLGPQDIYENLGKQVLPKLLEVLRQQKKP